MRNRFLMVLTIIAMIIGLNFAVHAPAIQMDFLYSDDYHLLTSSLQSPSRYFLGNWDGERGIGGFYRPLSIVYFKIDHACWKVNPLGYHLTNIIIHSFNSILVLLLAVLFFPNNPLIVASSAVIFSVLPLNAEAVNWVSGRTELIATNFYLLALYFYLLFYKKKRALFKGISLCAFTGSLLANEIAIAFPFLVLLLGLVERDPLKTIFKPLKWYLLIELFYFALRYFSLGTFVGGYDLSFRSLYETFLIRPVFGFLKIIWLLFMPFRQENLKIFIILFPLITMGCVYYLIRVVVDRRSSNFPFFCLALVFFGVLPAAINLSIGVDFQGTRLWYLPSAGLSLFMGWAFFNKFEMMGRFKRRVCGSFFIAFILYNVYFLNGRNNDWLIASNTMKNIRQNIIGIAAAYPKSIDLYFCNIPDNYKGCFVGLPSFAPLFYGKKINILTDLGHIDDIKNTKFFVYDPDVSGFRGSTYQYIISNKIPLFYNDHFSVSQFKRLRTFLFNR